MSQSEMDAALDALEADNGATLETLDEEVTQEETVEEEAGEAAQEEPAFWLRCHAMHGIMWNASTRQRSLVQFQYRPPTRNPGLSRGLHNCAARVVVKQHIPVRPRGS